MFITFKYYIYYTYVSIFHEKYDYPLFYVSQNQSCKNLETYMSIIASRENFLTKNGNPEDEANRSKQTCLNKYNIFFIQQTMS